jgi:NitT/TauT family transport system permease protein
MNALRRSGDTTLLTAALIGTWQLLYMAAGDTALPSPIDTLWHLARLLINGWIWPDIAETAYAFGCSLLFSYLIGLIIGVWFGCHRFSMKIGEPLLLALYAVPKVALFPTILLMCGLGLSAKIVFGALHGFVPVAIFTMNSISNTRPIYLKLARTLHLSRMQTLFQVLLPTILPDTVSGMRLGFSLTLLGVLIGEMFASKRGLGFVVMNSINLDDMRTVMAVALLLLLCAAIANSMLLWLERRIRRRTIADAEIRP